MTFWQLLERRKELEMFSRGEWTRLWKCHYCSWCYFSVVSHFAWSFLNQKNLNLFIVPQQTSAFSVVDRSILFKYSSYDHMLLSHTWLILVKSNVPSAQKFNSVTDIRLLGIALCCWQINSMMSFLNALQTSEPELFLSSACNIMSVWDHSITERLRLVGTFTVI